MLTDITQHIVAAYRHSFFIIPSAFWHHVSNEHRIADIYGSRESE